MDLYHPAVQRLILHCEHIWYTTFREFPGRVCAYKSRCAAHSFHPIRHFNPQPKVCRGVCFHLVEQAPHLCLRLAFGGGLLVFPGYLPSQAASTCCAASSFCSARGEKEMDFTRVTLNRAVGQPPFSLRGRPQLSPCSSPFQAFSPTLPEGWPRRSLQGLRMWSKNLLARQHLWRQKGSSVFLLTG